MIFSIKTNIYHYEWIIIIFLTLVLVIGVLYSTNTLHPGSLAKVDFISGFNVTKNLSSWSPDNFGYPSGLSQSEKFYKNMISSLPAFSFRDLIFYYLVPILFTAWAIFMWVDYHLQRHKIEDSKLVASCAVLLFFSSTSLVGVFAYGWNYVTLIPVAGLALTCHGIDRYYTSGAVGGLLSIAMGVFLIGGMVHFLLVPFLYLIDKSQKIVRLFIVLSIMILSSAYVLLPEIYQNLFTGAGHYRGVDPVQDTREVQLSLGMLERMTGASDPFVRSNWAYLPWLSIFAFGFLGLLAAMRYQIGTFGARMALFLFAGLHLSGISWDLSINRLWTYIPFVGGMFRNPDKIYYIFSLFLFILAALWLRKHRILRWLALTLVLLNAVYFFLLSDSRPLLQVANIELPQSYLEFSKTAARPRAEERILLLPRPKWFHFYSWIGPVQVTNVLKANVSVPVIWDEMVPSQNIPQPYVNAIESIEFIGSLDCSDAVRSARMMGITKIVLQRDLIGSTGKRINVEQNRLSLDKCFGPAIFVSDELIAYDVKESSGRIFIFDRGGKPNLDGNITSESFGFKVYTSHKVAHELVLREKTSQLTYLMFDSKFRRLDSYADADGWRRWVLPGGGWYYLVNTNSIVSIASILLTLITLLILLFAVIIVYSRRMLDKHRRNSNQESND